MITFGWLQNLLRQGTRCGIILLAGLALPTSAVASDMIGSMVGSVSGWVTDANGQQVAIEQGTVSGDVAVSTDTQGNVQATVTGTASCTGEVNVHINYSVTYNTNTFELSGTYTDPADSTARPILLTYQGDYQWQGQITDSVMVEGQSRPYGITIVMDLPLTALYFGTEFPTEHRRLSGPISSSLDLSVLIQLSQNGITIDQRVDTTIAIDGQWKANVVPKEDGSTAITGEASGTYSSGPISISVTAMGFPLTVSFSLSGQFGGSLFQDELGELFFAGTYGESIQSFSGLVPYSVSYSGDLQISVPIADGLVSDLPFSFSGSPLVEVSTLTSFSVPITVSGNFPFSMD